MRRIKADRKIRDRPKKKDKDREHDVLKRDAVLT